MYECLVMVCRDCIFTRICKQVAAEMGTQPVPKSGGTKQRQTDQEIKLS